MLLSVLIVIGPDLDPSIDRRELSFGEIVGTKFGELLEYLAIKEVRFLFPLSIFEVTLYG